jgi:hypothetical protein
VFPMNRFKDAWPIVLMSVAFVGGCSKNHGPERVSVSGSVAFKGQPVANGLIRFVPDADSGMPTVVASIINGKYAAQSHGGVPVGTHKVQIEGYSVQKGKEIPNDPVPDSVSLGTQYIPDKYNAHTTLTITVSHGSREITKDFNLTE